jgi:iron donor protein CyaY
MDESQFHRIADATLNHMLDVLESYDEDGAIDVEFQGGILTIALSDGQHVIISKHIPMRQLWLSSPVSGGLHFLYGSGIWQLVDGRKLYDIVARELNNLAKIDVDF